MNEKPYENLKILYVEDDEEVRISGVQAMKLGGFSVQAVEDAESAMAILRKTQDFVIVSDIRLPGISGMDLLAHAKVVDEDMPVILVTGHGDIAMAVKAMRDGAYDFIEKPYSSEHLLKIVGGAMAKRALTLENRRLRKQLEQLTSSSFIGETPVMQSVRQQISSLADTQVDILIMGETGTGKEVAAKALHNWSHKTGPFVAINCAGLPEGVFESEIFGHEAGAFTGATKRRIGHIEYANGGTLFLDEIESMPMSMQVKLLRVLQEREIERLGSNIPMPVDCRVIAATKADLLKLSEAGQFRSDLYYRLNVVTIHLPPLRCRTDDIPSLFLSFANRAAERYRRSMPDVPNTLLAKLQAMEWPGNVRELKNVAERYVLGQAPELQPEVTEHSPGNLSKQVYAYEKQLLISALKTCNGVVVDAALQLGLPRKTLYDKLARFRIDPLDFRVT